MSAQYFDVVVIGAGPGGYIASIKLAKLGKKVACIDEWIDLNNKSKLGGTCTNVGCIPSKALLHSSELYDQTGNKLKDHGIEIMGRDLNLKQMMDRKDKVIADSNKGISYLFNKNKVTSILGKASFTGVKNQQSFFEVMINNRGQNSCIYGKDIIIATGSKSRKLQQIDFDEDNVLSNVGALSIKSVPESITLIGGGVIGLELGSVWRRLGSKITVLETMPSFLNSADSTISKSAYAAFTNQGMDIKMNIDVESVESRPGSVKIKYTDKVTNTKKEIISEKILVSIGRMPNYNNLNIKSLDIELDALGRISVDDYCQTNISNIWAIGDVVRGPMLAHKAEEEGVMVAEKINGQYCDKIKYTNVPWVIYTDPEIAWVGYNEQQLKDAGIKYKIGISYFSSNGRARSMGNTSGFVKIIADLRTDEVLGVHIVGHYASELISHSVLAMDFRASSEDLSRSIYAHPTLSETIKEAALDVDSQALNQ